MQFKGLLAFSLWNYKCGTNKRNHFIPYSRRRARTAAACNPVYSRGRARRVSALVCRRGLVPRTDQTPDSLLNESGSGCHLSS